MTDIKESETAEVVAEKRPGNRMSDKDWTDCKIKWASGQYSLPELSDLFGITKSAIWRRLNRAKVKKGADKGAYEADQQAKQIEDATNAVAERDSRIRTKAIEAEEFLLNAVDGVARQGLKAIVDARKNHLPISSAMDDVKTAKEAVAMFKTAVETIQKIRGVDKLEEDELPHLMVTGLTQKDMEDIRAAQDEERHLFGEDDADEILDDLDDAGGINEIIET